MRSGVGVGGGGGGGGGGKRERDLIIQGHYESVRIAGSER